VQIKKVDEVNGSVLVYAEQAGSGKDLYTFTISSHNIKKLTGGFWIFSGSFHPKLNI